MFVLRVFWELHHCDKHKASKDMQFEDSSRSTVNVFVV